MEVLYFAWVAEKIGRDSESVDAPDAVSTIAALIDWLAARGGGYTDAFADRSKLRAALDQQFAPLDAPLAGARELALFPPVTGG